jgi:hypothetical protein
LAPSLHPLGAEPVGERDAELAADEVVHRDVEAALGDRLAGVEARGELLVHALMEARDVERVVADDRGGEVMADRADRRLDRLGRPARARPGLAPADRAVVAGHLHDREALSLGDRARGAARQGQHRLDRQADRENLDLRNAHRR